MEGSIVRGEDGEVGSYIRVRVEGGIGDGPTEGCKVVVWACRNEGKGWREEGINYVEEAVVKGEVLGAGQLGYQIVGKKQ